jgi:hypothetical protein
VSQWSFILRTERAQKFLRPVGHRLHLSTE